MRVAILASAQRVHHSNCCCGMHIVTTGMHDAGALGCPGESGLLNDRQRI
jgi:hypothetical protein